jgi:uncharacterized protein involved in outer membrane biogenesis
VKKALVGVVVLLVAGVVAAPFLVPVSSFIPELTRVAAEKLGQPVSIQDLKLHLVPTPRVIASGISVGRKNDVTVGELEIVPDLMSLVSGARTVRLVRAEKVVVLESALAIPKAMPKSGSDGEAVRVRRVEVKDVTLRHSKVKLPPFDVEAVLGESLRVEEARFQTRDGALHLLVDSSSRVELKAKNWTLPAGTPLVFESLTAEGTYKGDTIDLPKIDGKLYGGTLAGSARADWAKLWVVSGKASLAGVDLVPVQKAMGKPAKLSGRLKTQQTFSSRAKAPDQLAGALATDGPFEVVGGSYSGVDLTKVADLTGKSKSDATQFEEFKGKLNLRAQRVKINELCVRSPKVVAGGNVEIAPDQTLSGKLDVSLARSGGFVGVPVALSGTTADPSVRPTKGYMIGAAVGTILLPGIGTSLGASAGSRVEGTSSGCK